jgi:hypothetical protein
MYYGNKNITFWNTKHIMWTVRTMALGLLLNDRTSKRFTSWTYIDFVYCTYEYSITNTHHKWWVMDLITCYQQKTMSWRLQRLFIFFRLSASTGSRSLHISSFNSILIFIYFNYYIFCATHHHINTILMLITSVLPMWQELKEKHF